MLSFHKYILFCLGLTRSGSVIFSPRHPLEVGRGWLGRLRSCGKRRRSSRFLHGPMGRTTASQNSFQLPLHRQGTTYFPLWPYFRKQGAPTRSNLGLAPLTVCRNQVSRDEACHSSAPAVFARQLPVPPVLGSGSRHFLGWSPAGLWVRSPLRMGLLPGPVARQF